MEHMMNNYGSILQGWVYVGLISSLALALYFGTVFMVGRARMKYKIHPPATTGNPDFERYFRVQQNTLEQIVIFLPSLWMFAIATGRPKLAALIGLVWIAGRALYAKDYYESAPKRMKGFVIGLVASSILLAGSIIGFLFMIF